jgi:hypothetical protein
VRRSIVSAAIVSAWVVTAASSALAQGASVDLSAGRIVYQPLAASVQANNVIGTLRYESTEDWWIYGTTGVPLRSGDAWWGATGGGGRLQVPSSGPRTLQVGVDAGLHGYLFRDSVLGHTGTGATLDAIPFAALSSGRARLELRGGMRGHTLSYGGVRESRGVLEAGVRATYGTTARVEVDAHWVRATEGTYPFVGGTLEYGGRPVQVWIHGGKWLSADLDEVSWGGGIGVALGQQATLWGRVWQEAPDPLYWNVARRSWAVGVTHRFGRATPVLPRALRSVDGVVVVSVPKSEMPVNTVWIAGDFNAWQPEPMTADGPNWVIHLPLRAGVYYYAFRSEDGRWLLPPSVTHRTDDGFGGEVAVLVVG